MPDLEAIEIGRLVFSDIKLTWQTIRMHFEGLPECKPDVVIQTARDSVDFGADEEIIRLLKAGINVITLQPHQYPVVHALAMPKKGLQ